MNEKIVQAMAELNEKLLFYHIQIAFQNGEPSQNVYKCLSEGLKLVGKKYEEGEYYIADLIVAGELIKKILATEEMSLRTSGDQKFIGKVAVGTVFQDIHDVGKDIFISMLEAAGFETIDLGVDVPPERFIQCIREDKPDIIGISGVLSIIGSNIKIIIDRIKEENIREDVKIIVGGASVNDKLFEFVGADAFSIDASEGVRICKNWMGIEE
ncbi:methanogenic corrinoid protein MtbC1 [Alkalibaculum bacchi]|uniref:Methanogenic corrinoid protein MtbC1 n=1 Tax=Alkalibaculum bacchi TaxID=645887 RepID=A0A366I9V2_9FIRM|nr:cobalamin-dependent protein [Alkalibaculum bacchi]RBP66723.1 methanogenic corrinoid protein MtbC1 [Alkalibaculum bacchi]